MRIKHVNLGKTADGKLTFELKSQKTAPDERNTSAVYIVEDNDLTISGMHLPENQHPKFKNVGQMEAFCNRYFATQTPWILNDGTIKFDV